jgi:hypothetical protein
MQFPSLGSSTERLLVVFHSFKGKLFSGRRKNEKCVQKMYIWRDSFKRPELGLEGTEQSLNVPVLVLKETSSSPSPNPHYIRDGRTIRAA